MLVLQPLDFFMLRRSTGSIADVESFHNSVDNLSIRYLLRQWLSNPLTLEGLRLSSSALYARIELWLKNGEISEEQALLKTLYQYFLRSSTRCTPFGTFAGCCMGQVSDKTEIEFSPDDELLFRVTPDFLWQSRFVRQLATNSTVKLAASICLNTSIYRNGNNLRYIERKYTGDAVKYYLSSVEVDGPISKVLDLVSPGITYNELLQSFVDDCYNASDVEWYLDSLLFNDIIEFSFKPVVIGQSFTSEMIHALTPLEQMADTVEKLKSVDNAFTFGCTNISDIRAIEKLLFDLAGDSGTNPPVKVDTYLTPLKKTLSQSVVDTIATLLTDLEVLNRPLISPALQEFKKRFRARYDTLEVPLLLVLDPDLGIGFPGSGSAIRESGGDFVSQLLLPEPEQEEMESKIWYQEFILSKYYDAISRGQDEIKLTQDDLKTLRKKCPPASSARNAKTCYAVGTILGKSQDAVDTGDFRFCLNACQGPSAINMMSRFASGDPNACDALKRCISIEETFNPNVILAEVVHDPDTKAGNVMMRPSLYHYEINYLGKSAGNNHQQINVSDIMVSVSGDTIMLRCRRQNKRIIPRLSNMHNYKQGLPVYRFLASLQAQDTPLNIGWEWGVLRNQSFLPRVVYKNLILFRKTWHVSREDLRVLNLKNFMDCLIAKQVSQRVMLIEGDNEMFFDLTVSLSRQLLFDFLLKKEHLRLVESLDSRENSILSSGEKFYHHELIIPFTISSGNARFSPAPDINETALQIPNVPGSEWLYLKIYGSENAIDDLLCSQIAIFVERLWSSNRIDKCFFVRYNDPEHHLRIRFHSSKSRMLYQIAKEFNSCVATNLSNQHIYKILVDTYQPEINRYGADKIHLFEQYFSEESKIILSYLIGSKIKRQENARLEFALQYAINIFEILKFDDIRSKIFCESQRDYFLREFSASSGILRSLYPLVKQCISKFSQSSNLEFYDNTLCLPQIIKSIFSGSNSENKHLASVVHMMVNRVFPSRQRKIELVLYHILFKIYDSRIARKRRRIGLVDTVINSKRTSQIN